MHDLELDPAAYPWLELAGEQLPDSVGDEARTPVVAVGSNASPVVLRRKLGELTELGIARTERLVPDLAVGHSAHLSRGGYVPAAPWWSPGARTTFVVDAFTEAQLARVDATEPNYQRLALPGGGPHVYVSLHGVLDAGCGPLPLGSQEQVWRWLADYGTDPASWPRRPSGIPGAGP